MASDGFENRRRERRERRLEDARNLREFRDRVGSPHTDGLTPQAIHHWRTEDQIDALVEARLSEPGLGFMSALLATCSLPRKDPGDTFLYVRKNGPFSLYLSRNGEERLPYGILPRLLLAWICTEVVRTQSPKIWLGPSLAAFMRELGVQSSDSGGKTGIRTRVRDQMHRLFGASLQLRYESQTPNAENEMESETVTAPIADSTHLWWQPKDFSKSESWRSTVQLGHRFFNEIVLHPVPIDLNILRAMKRSSLGVDVYLWLTYRLNCLHKPIDIAWPQLYRQFGARPEADTTVNVDTFRKLMVRELGKLRGSWPGLRYQLKHGYLQLQPSVRRISRK